MPAFAAWHTAGSYSVIIATDRDAVWDAAEAKGVKLLAVTELPSKGEMKRGKLRERRIEDLRKEADALEADLRKSGTET